MNRVVDRDELMATARELADRIAEAAPLATRAVKAVVRAAEGLGAEEAYGAMRATPAYREMLASEDADEGPRASPRAGLPVWRGR